MISDASPSRSLTGEWWAELIAFHPDPGAYRSASRVALAVATPLAVTLAIGHVEWSAYGVFGSLTAVYGKRFGYRDRLIAGAGVGILLVAAVVGGAIAGVVHAGSWPSIVVMTVVSMLGLFVSRWRGWLPVPSLFLVFAAGAIGSIPQRPVDVAIAAGISTAAAITGIALGQLGQLLPRRLRRNHPSAPTPVPLQRILGARGVRRQLVLHGLGPLAAGTIALGLGIGHPYWAAVSATVPLVGVTVAAQFARGSLRFAGTLIGVILAFLLLSTQPPVWLLLFAIGIFQLLTELFVARNYGLAVICITPLALTMLYLADPAPPLELAADRVIETTIGIAVSLTLVLVTRRPRVSHHWPV